MFYKARGLRGLVASGDLASSTIRNSHKLNVKERHIYEINNCITYGMKVFKFGPINFKRWTFYHFSSGVLPVFLAISNPDGEKISTHEYQKQEKFRHKILLSFNIIHYILFRTCLSFPLRKSKISSCGFWFMMIFLAVLTIGFIYEWCKGALE